MNVTKTEERMSLSKVIIGIILAIVILIVAQNLALNLCEIPLMLGVPGSICNIFVGILYVIFTYIGVKLLCNKYLRIPMTELRIPKIRVRILWILVAIIMPVLVLLISMLLGGTWKTNNIGNSLSIVTSAVAFYGLAAGMVEEMIFRGIIMGCLEKKFGIIIAMTVPSVLFGLLHIVGNDLDVISIVQLVIAGSIVGILFSLISYESNSIWNSAIVHGIWNMVMVGGIVHIGSGIDRDSIYNFVLSNKSFLLSGGDFGIESSIISIGVYLVFCAVAIFFIMKKKG